MRPEAKPIKFTNGHAHFYMKNKVDRTMHTEPPVVPSVHFACGFLVATDYALKRPKTLKYGILPQ